jgi:AraC-like DNA-binding protein
MDLGYGSLAPFNRAFRETVGQAPSEYRRENIVRN